MLLNGGELDGVRILGRKTVEYMTADHMGPEIDATLLRAYPNINGYGFGLGVAVRRGRGISGVNSSPGEFHWAGSTGTYFWCRSRGRARRRFHGACAGRDPLLPSAAPARAGDAGARLTHA